jgi:hypothetical protein
MGSESACAYIQRCTLLTPVQHLHTFLLFKKRTVSSVFCMSGILSLSPAARRCVFDSMNWYFLGRVSPSISPALLEKGVRDHLLEAVYGAFDLGAIGNIVLNSVDEGRNWYAARVRGRIVASSMSVGPH